MYRSIFEKNLMYIFVPGENFCERYCNQYCPIKSQTLYNIFVVSPAFCTYVGCTVCMMRGRCYTGIYVASTASRLASVFALLCSRTVKKIMKLRRNPVCNCVALYLPFSFSLCLHVSLSFIKTKQPNQLSSILITTLKSKMPSNKFKCCKEVKDHFIFHKKCVSRSGGNKTGAFLNAHLKDSSPF